MYYRRSLLTALLGATTACHRHARFRILAPGFRVLEQVDETALQAVQRCSLWRGVAKVLFGSGSPRRGAMIADDRCRCLFVPSLRSPRRTLEICPCWFHSVRFHCQRLAGRTRMTHRAEKATIFHCYMRLRILEPSFRIVEEVVGEQVQAKMMQTVQNWPGLVLEPS